MGKVKQCKSCGNELEKGKLCLRAGLCPTCSMKLINEEKREKKAKQVKQYSRTIRKNKSKFLGKAIADFDKYKRMKIEATLKEQDSVCCQNCGVFLFDSKTPVEDVKGKWVAHVVTSKKVYYTEVMASVWLCWKCHFKIDRDGGVKGEPIENLWNEIKDYFVKNFNIFH